MTTTVKQKVAAGLTAAVAVFAFRAVADTTMSVKRFVSYLNREYDAQLTEGDRVDFINDLEAKLNGFRTFHKLAAKNFIRSKRKAK